jgi:hypothetical protein
VRASRRTLAAIAASCAACAACAWIVGIQNVGDKADNTGDAGATDAPTDAPTEGSTAVDSGTDTGSTGDGPTEGSSDAAAAADGTFCQLLQPVPAFCFDWDEVPSSLHAGFMAGSQVMVTWLNFSNGGTASVGTPARSPPGAFVAATPVNPPGTALASYYSSSAGGSSASSAHLRFSMDLIDFDAASVQEADLAEITFNSPDGGYFAAFFDITFGQAQITVGDAGFCTLPTTPGYHDYELTAQLQPTQAQLSVDDAGVICTSTGASPFGGPATAGFGLGSKIVPPASATTIAFDNVVLSVP